MELTVDKALFSKAIGFVSGVTAQKQGAIPILSNILIETTGKDGLNLVGTDLEVGISTQVQAEVIKEGSVTLPAKKLQEIFREMPAGNVEVSVAKNNAVTIRSGKSNFKIMGLGREDYPKLPERSSKDAVVLEQGVVKECLALTAFAISHDETRYVLNGVLIMIHEKKIRFVATDGRRLACAEKSVESKIAKNMDLIVPIKAIAELGKILEWEGEVRITQTQNQAVFDLGKTFLTSRLIEGKFPDYEQVIPKDSTIVSQANREELLQAIRRAELLTSPESPAVKMDFMKGKILVSSRSQNLGEAKEELVAETKGGEITVGFNPHYFMDVLKNLDTENISVHLSNPDRPGLLRGKEGYQYVIMPMQLS